METAMENDEDEAMKAKMPICRSFGWASSLWIFLFLTVSSAWSLDPTLQVTQYAHSVWSARDGAFRGTIQAITQTPDGYLWMATGFGLLRFDGVRFVEWHAPTGSSLPKPPFWTVYASRDGSLWIGTREGFSRIKNGKVRTFPGGNVSAITEDRNGTVWAGSGSQLCSIQEDQEHCVGQDGTFGTSIDSIYEDPAGNLWVGAVSGLWRWKPGAPQRYRYNGVGGVAQSLAVDEHGNVLLANYKELRGLIGGKEQAYPIQSHGTQFGVRALLKDKDGGIWIGSEGQGLMHMHEGKIDTYRREDGLSKNSVVTLFEDREGNIWVSTDDTLDRFHEVAIPTVTSKQIPGLDSVGSVLAASDGSLWISGNVGVLHMGGGGTERYSSAKGLPDDYVSSMFEDDQNRILISTAKGYVWVQKGKILRTQIPGDEALSVAQDSSGNYWITDHQQGLIHANTKGQVLDVTPWKRFQGMAYFVAADRLRGGIWLGFDRGGLTLFKDGKVQENYGPSQGIDGAVRDIQVEGDGTIWASTEGGLVRLSDGKVTLLNSHNGLPCDYVFWKRGDGQGSQWLRTPCGLVRLAQSELDAWVHDPQHKVKITRVFDHSNGVAELSHPSYYSPQVAKMDGRLFFLESGLGVIDPHKLPSNKLKPPTIIEQITADGKDCDMSLPTVKIPPVTRDLNIQYTALSLVDAQQVRFRYKLENRDREWQDPGTRRQAFYSDLHPGHYRFRVIASNNDGLWNEEGAALNLEVEPAWYQTVWFLVSSVAAFGLILGALYRLRLQQLERQFDIILEARVKERGRIARDLHDRMLGSFYGLLLKLQTVYDLLPTRPLDAECNLKQVIGQAAEAISEGRQAVEGLRSSTSKTNDLADALRTCGKDMLEEGRYPTLTAFRVVVEGTPRHLHAMIREEVYQIAAEALRNAVLHAQARQIEVEIHYDRRQFQLLVRDDGRGIDPEVLAGGGARDGHFGLLGMRERATIAGGKLAFRSKLSFGTEIGLTISASIAYATSRPQFWWLGRLGQRHADERGFK